MAQSVILAVACITSIMSLDETKLMYVSTKGLLNARGAFDKLESKLASLKGRKFFGYYNPETEEYRACVAVATGDADPEGLGLSTWAIPKGNYAYEKIENWSQKTNLIGPTVDKLIKGNGSRIDWSRPILEFYKSINELRLLVPVKD